jgi:signal transduction histidine kinase
MIAEKKLKILMLEDSQQDAELIERVIKRENIAFIKERVDTKQEYLDAISRFQPDIVLSDHGLPQFNSREALKICLKECPKTPFIIVTGTMSDEYAVSCIHNGADDYILKSNLARLPAAMLGAIKKRKIERLKREARHALRRQNNELQKVNSELDNFVYSVSHNLRGPLVSVVGLLNLAKQERDIRGVTDLHAMMESSLRRMDETLKEILEFSQNARNEVRVDKIDWKLMINSCFARLEYLDRENNVGKFISIKEKVPFYSDAGRLFVILTNLFSNSLQFGDHLRDPLLGIEIDVDQDARIIIKDNGIGISKDVLPRIFEMFYRGTEKSKGAGLGLYVVKEIVSKLGGKILVDSEPGNGSTFTITIPNSNNVTSGK